MPRRYSIGKRKASIERTRAAIISALLDLIRSVPYDAITVRQIAQEADVAERTVQRHFPSKDAIFIAYARRAIKDLSDVLEESANGASPRSALAQLVAAIYDQYERHAEEVWALVREAPSSDEISRYLASVRAYGDELAGRLIDRWPDAWRLGRDRTQRLLAGSLRFLTWKVLRDECGLTHQETVSAIIDAVTRSLMKPEVVEEPG